MKCSKCGAPIQLNQKYCPNCGSLNVENAKHVSDMENYDSKFNKTRKQVVSNSKWFVKYVGQIGLPVINFHGLRHTNASLLVAQNIDIAVISARLGHAQISTTLDFYVHPLLSHNRKAGYALENLLLPTKS